MKIYLEGFCFRPTRPLIPLSPNLYFIELRWCFKIAFKFINVLYPLPPLFILLCASMPATHFFASKSEATSWAHDPSPRDLLWCDAIDRWPLGWLPFFIKSEKKKMKKTQSNTGWKSKVRSLWVIFKNSWGHDFWKTLGVPYFFGFIAFLLKHFLKGSCFTPPTSLWHLCATMAQSASCLAKA